MNTEIGNLLNVQKEQLDKIEEQKVLLLGSASDSNKYDHIKEAFGWNDTDKSLREDTNKILELSKRVKENVDSSVLTEDILHKYCIANNYILTNVRNYKGKIPDELLAAIDEYCSKNDRRLSSEANIQNLYILCQFTDVHGDNHNLKKSKRYKKTRLPKIILLEKLDKGNAYTEQHYKTIFEIGEMNRISNFFKSIYLTHGKAGNHARYLALFSGILAIVLGITFLFSNIGEFSRERFQGIWIWTKIFMFIALLIMIIKSFASQTRPAEAFLQMCYHAGDSTVDRSSNCSRWFLTSYMFKDYESSYVKHLSFVKSQIAMWSMNIAMFLFFSGVIHLMKCYEINKQKVINYEVERVKAPDKINDIVTFETYKPTSKFTYSKVVSKELTGRK